MQHDDWLEFGIYLSFVLLIEDWIEGIKRLVQVTNLNQRMKFPLPLRTQSDTSLCSVQGLRTSCASVV
jgi:hypothetical protein